MYRHYNKEQIVKSAEFRKSFGNNIENLEVKYGLPSTIKFCSKCVISNQRPNSAIEFNHTKNSIKETIHFDDQLICDACAMAEKKKNTIDWADRERELVDLCNQFRRDDGQYDCLVPGSGGKDSFYQAHILKYKYGMNPLTVTWAPHMYTDWGRHNFYAWLGSGFDNYLMTPNPKTHRLLTRLALESLLHPFQPFMIGQKSFAPKIAASMGISLIFYGENEAEYGNPIKDNDSAQRQWDYFMGDNNSKIHLSGVSLSDLEEHYGLRKVDLDPYMPINPSLMSENNIQVHYLGYYLQWHPQAAYYYAVENGDFIASPERTPGTYSKYNSIDDKIDDLHYYTTFIKFGIGRASYDAAQEIRNDDITRDEGVALVRKFDGEVPTRFLDEIFDYLSMNESEYPIASKLFEQPKMNREYFDNLVDSFRSPHLWALENDNWVLRSKV